MGIIHLHFTYTCYNFTTKPEYDDDDGCCQIINNI